jgi:hypothetical protein
VQAARDGLVPKIGEALSALLDRTTAAAAHDDPSPEVGA